MQVTGKNLALVKDALVRAMSDVHMEIGACPAVKEYGEELAELEREHESYAALLASIERREQEREKLLHDRRIEETFQQLVKASHELHDPRRRPSNPVQRVRANVLEFKRR